MSIYRYVEGFQMHNLENLWGGIEWNVSDEGEINNISHTMHIIREDFKTPNFK